MGYIIALVKILRIKGFIIGVKLYLSTYLLKPVPMRIYFNYLMWKLIPVSLHFHNE